MTIVIGKASVPDLQDEIEKCLKKKVIIIDTNQYERGGFESTVDEKGNSKKEFQGKTPFTTRHALEREKATIELMNKGKGACNAIITKKRADELLIDLNDKLDEKSKLNEGQLEAAKAILTSKDRIHGIQGYAGTGKTYMLSKVTEILHKVNEEKLQKDPKHIPYQLQGLAPSGAAVKELQKVGIKSQTIQSLTAKYAGYAEGRGTLKGIKEEREKFVNKIFVTDEASMVDAAQMQDFMVISSKLNIRSALMGDIRQLPAVGAGRPAYEMQRQGMSLVKMTEIRRQENKVGKAIAYSAYARDFHGIFEKVGSNLVDCSVLKERTVKPGKEVVVNNSDTALAAAKLYFTFDKQKREGTLMVAQSNNTKDLVNEFVREILINKNE
ncbi:MAG: ATP-dependent exoDNAse (exonuclease V) alpha subunit, partial [Rickettsiales bacterium]